MSAKRGPGDAGAGPVPGAVHVAGEAVAVTSPTRPLDVDALLADPTIPDPGGPAALAELPALAASARIGRFTVLRKIGSGGMGVVYAAYDEELDRKLAIKIIHAREDEGGRAGIRLRREAKAMARLSHPHVVQVFQVGEYEGRVFVAMEFVQGPTLDAWLRGDGGGDHDGGGGGGDGARRASQRAGQLPGRRSWREIVAMHIGAGHGLAAAHAAGLVHRDYKPSNVMVSRDGRARVLDFGLVRQGDSTDGAALPSITAALNTLAVPGHDILSASLTIEGAIIGTPSYMSPEQLTGQPADARSDQFSFCVTLYEALYGVNPFASPTMPARVMRIMSNAVAPPPPGAGVPPWVHEALVRGLRCEPEERWPSMDALLAALAHDPDAAPDAGTALRHTRRPMILGAAAFAAVAVATLLVHDHIDAARAAASSPVGALVVSVLVAAVYVLLLLAGRRRLLATRIGRRLMAFGGITCGGIVLTRVVPVFVPVPFEHGFVYGQIVIACLAAAGAVTILAPLRWIAAVWLALVPLSLWHMEHAATLQSLGLLATCALGAVYWSRR